MPYPKKPEAPTVYLALRWTDDGMFAILLVSYERQRALSVCRSGNDFILAVPDETPGRYRAALGYYPHREPERKGLA